MILREGHDRSHAVCTRLWIIFFVALCVLVVLMLRQQTHAYRYRLVGVAGMVGVSVLFLAMGLHFLRLPDRAERYAERGVPPLARPWLMRGHPRLRPEDGVLIGRLTEIQPDHFVVERPPHEIWKVRIDPVRFQYRRFQVHDDIVARGHVIKPWVFKRKVFVRTVVGRSWNDCQSIRRGAMQINDGEVVVSCEAPDFISFYFFSHHKI